MAEQYTVSLGEGKAFSVAEAGPGVYTVDGKSVEVVAMPGGSYRVFVEGKVLAGYAISTDKAERTAKVMIGNQAYSAEITSALDKMLAKFGGGAAGAAKTADLKAPMPGLVHKVLVTAGQKVEKGTPLLVLVAMKMENMIKAAGPGTVSAVPVAEGDKVEKGAVLVRF